MKQRNNEKQDADFSMEEELQTKLRAYRKSKKKASKPNKDDVWESRWN